MALTNAERQARYKKRIKDRLAREAALVDALAACGRAGSIDDVRRIVVQVLPEEA